MGGRTVRVSNPDKIYFPEREITKRQVVEHYVAVAEPLLGVLRDRPTHLRRYVDGVTGEWFYAKRLPKGAPDYVETVQVRFPSGRPADVLCPTEPAVLAWAANLGTFDFHPWPVRRPDVDAPDELRIDLDPQPGTDFADAARVAATLREVLTEAGLVGWPKTSGGRGIHVMVPPWHVAQIIDRRKMRRGGEVRIGQPVAGEKIPGLRQPADIGQMVAHICLRRADHFGRRRAAAIVLAHEALVDTLGDQRVGGLFEKLVVEPRHQPPHLDALGHRGRQ